MDLNRAAEKAYKTYTEFVRKQTGQLFPSYESLLPGDKTLWKSIAWEVIKTTVYHPEKTKELVKVEEAS